MLTTCAILQHAASCPPHISQYDKAQADSRATPVRPGRSGKHPIRITHRADCSNLHGCNGARRVNASVKQCSTAPVVHAPGTATNASTQGRSGRSAIIADAGCRCKQRPALCAAALVHRSSLSLATRLTGRPSMLNECTGAANMLQRCTRRLTVDLHRAAAVPCHSQTASLKQLQPLGTAARR
jgi:hypothetical protein